jgi:hypothetical protein
MKWIALAFVLVACGSSSPAPSTPGASATASASPPSSRPSASAAAAPSGRTVRVVRIDSATFERFVKTDLATAKKWAADPANAKSVLPVFRHILVKAPAGDAPARAAARRKVEDLIARLDRGEDFATLAKSSDDPGSAKNGGAYPGRMVRNFVSEVRHAYDELRPGERARGPVETSFGWHVIEKGPVDDDACVDGHHAWLARNAAERVGRDLAKRLRHVEGASATEVERSYIAVAPMERKALDQLPIVVRMDAATCDGYVSIAQGEGMTWRDDVLFVAALTNDERNASEVDAEGCEPLSSGMSPAVFRALIEREQEKQRAQPKQ